MKTVKDRWERFEKTLLGNGVPESMRVLIKTAYYHGFAECIVMREEAEGIVDDETRLISIIHMRSECLQFLDYGTYTDTSEQLKYSAKF